jgi:hypothetical protein
MQYRITLFGAATVAAFLIGLGPWRNSTSRATTINGDTCLPGTGCPVACSDSVYAPAHTTEVDADTGVWMCKQTSSDWACHQWGEITCGTYIEYFGTCTSKGAVMDSRPQLGVGCNY